MGSHTCGLDLNYRLDLPDEDIRKLLLSHESGIDSIQTLLLYDQLRAAMRSNKAFGGFKEHHITYFPYVILRPVVLRRCHLPLTCDSTYRLALGVSKGQLEYDTK